MTKVLVIGGGPAGLYAATKAAQLGINVTLLEKGHIGENIRCAEGFFDTMKVLGKPEAGVRFKVEQIIIKAKSLYKIDAQPLNLWMIDRACWQKNLARQAKSSGVELKEDFKVKPQDLKTLKKEYDYIIDASGAPSVTSRAYGFNRFYKNNSGKTVQRVVEGDFSHIGYCLKAGLMSDFWGYYWIFPKGIDEGGKSVANVGVGDFYALKNDKLWERLDTVMEAEGLTGSGYKILQATGGICPTKMLDRLIYDNILLVGDAAGLTSPLHGGGIDMAVISGEEAAKSIASNINSYEKNLKTIFRKKLRFERILTAIWRQRNLDEMDNLLANLEKYKIYRLFTEPDSINDLSMKFLEKTLLK